MLDVWAAGRGQTTLDADHVGERPLETRVGREDVGELRGYRTRLKDSPALADLARRAAALEGEEGDDSGKPETFGRLRGSLSSLLSLLQGADEAPTTQGAAAVADRLQASDALMQRWAALRTELQGAVK